MLDQQTINKLYELKLTGMAEAFADQLKEPDMDIIVSALARELWIPPRRKMY